MNPQPQFNNMYQQPQYNNMNPQTQYNNMYQQPQNMNNSMNNLGEKDLSCSQLSLGQTNVSNVK